jgi:HK97 family phage prohead protease
VSNTLEIRATAGLQEDSGKLVGYAAVFNSRSHDLGGFVEVIEQGAFARTLTENPDILALMEHDTAKVLARTTNGTLTVTEDARGLRVEIDPADTSYGRDLLALVRRGDVHGMSFRFRPYPGGEKRQRGLRTLTSVMLKEVSVVVDPAYPAAAVEVRNAMQDEVNRANQLDALERRLRIAAL